MFNIDPYAGLARASRRARAHLASLPAPKASAATGQPAKAAAPKPKAEHSAQSSAVLASMEAAARPFVALIEAKAAKPKAAAVTTPAPKVDNGNWKAAHARAAGRPVPLAARTGGNHGWAKIVAKINPKKGK